MSADPADWLDRGGLLVVAFTVGMLCVAPLRRASRQLFGAECAATLWLLPPLAMAASQLPHAADAVRVLSSGSWLVVLPASVAWLPAPVAQGLDWHAVVAWLWPTGVAAWLGFAARAQLRFRAGLHGSVPLARVAVGWPVLRAASPMIGPALVGAWRPCIVVPADFEQRYAADERRLILAHEAMHARRGDGYWLLLAQACAALCWFHPLAWWALGALRQDQELACDAAVLRECGGSRRSYAQALLKTPTATNALPIGCSWSSRHPLTERIAMLKAPQPSSRRRLVGLLTGLCLAAGVTGIVYAASAPAGRPRAPSGEPSAPVGVEYQLDMEVSVLGEAARASEAQRLKLALCTEPGEPASISTHGLQLDAVAQATPDHRLRVLLTMRKAPDAKPVHAQLKGEFDEPMLASGKLSDGDSRYLVQLTPREGCPARAAADEAAHAPVTMKLTQGTVRGAAELIAHQAGLSLDNPQVLGNGPAAMEFRDVPADRAMRTVANLAGVDVAFNGRRVRFVAR